MPPVFGVPYSQNQRKLMSFLVIVISSRLQLSRRGVPLKNQVVATLLLITVIVSSASVWLYEQPAIQASYDSGYRNGVLEAYNPINVGASAVQFNATELQNFENIKSRLVINNTDHGFPGNRTLQLISMRNSTSAPWDPYQKSMEYLCFWSGRGANGEWEAVVSIYNEWGSLSDYVVEVSRFTWHSLDVIFDNKVMTTFPQVLRHDISWLHHFPC